MKEILIYTIYILILFSILPILFLLSLTVLITSGFPILHWSLRIGKNSKTFYMPKFRTMNLNTPNIETDLLENADNYYTKFGKIMRKYSFDELPQIYNLLNRTMTIVGPRPALFNQYDLIAIRKKLGVDKVLPGITGLAQISGRDKLNSAEKAKIDLEYVKKKSVKFDTYIMMKTIYNVIFSKDIKH